jgi:hypothetical protein
MRFVILVMVIFMDTSCSAQVKNCIYYDLPEAVTSQIREHIESSLSENKSLLFVAQIYKDVDNNHVVSIVDYTAKDSSDSFGLLYSEVVMKSNRMLRIDDYVIPIMISEDMVFADLGEAKMPDGRIAKKRVLMTFDGFTITFDRSGKIFDN